jgi:branched-chain amino acid transport system ATP-binding protein
MTLLEVRALSAGYGDIQALWGVDLDVRAGQATVILGRNGAGKSTLLLAIAGLLRGKSGSVKLSGKDITRLPTHRRARSGMALVQENKRIFRRLSVEHNLMLGGYTLARAPRRRALDQAYARFPALAAKRNATAATLSGGQQQMLAIAQALMPDPALLMLDEPSAGLAPVIVAEVVATVGRLKAEGLGIVLVEQLVDQAMGVADHVIVLEHGRSLMSEPASGLDVRRVRQMYLASGSRARTS